MVDTDEKLTISLSDPTIDIIYLKNDITPSFSDLADKITGNKWVTNKLSTILNNYVYNYKKNDGKLKGWISWNGVTIEADKIISVGESIIIFDSVIEPIQNIVDKPEELLSQYIPDETLVINEFLVTDEQAPTDFYPYVPLKDTFKAPTDFHPYVPLKDTFKAPTDFHPYVPLNITSMEMENVFNKLLE